MPHLTSIGFDSWEDALYSLLVVTEPRVAAQAEHWLSCAWGPSSRFQSVHYRGHLIDCIYPSWPALSANLGNEATCYQARSSRDWPSNVLKMKPKHVTSVRVLYNYFSIFTYTLCVSASHI